MNGVGHQASDTVLIEADKRRHPKAETTLYFPPQEWTFGRSSSLIAEDFLHPALERDVRILQEN